MDSKDTEKENQGEMEQVKMNSPCEGLKLRHSFNKDTSMFFFSSEVGSTLLHRF